MSGEGEKKIQPLLDAERIVRMTILRNHPNATVDNINMDLKPYHENLLIREATAQSHKTISPEHVEGTLFNRKTIAAIVETKNWLLKIDAYTGEVYTINSY